MRKPWCTSHIADGIDTGHSCAAIGIRRDMGAVDFNAERLKPKILHIADDPNRRDHRVKHLRGDFAVLFDMRCHRALAAIELYQNYNFCYIET